MTVVLGGAESGVGAAILAKVKGLEVFLSDSSQIGPQYVALLEKWGVPYEQGGHSEQKILSCCTELVKSPGIPQTAPLVRKLSEKGIPVISEIEFASRYDSSRKICITGSNGKTTTTTLIHHILCSAGIDAALGGNIGKGYALQVATGSHECYVLEISSFQLDGCYSFRPDEAIIMNVTPDHLDRYGFKMENYTSSKFRICRNLRDRDFFIFDKDDPVTTRHMEGHPVKTGRQLPFSIDSAPEGDGAWMERGVLKARLAQESFEIPVAQIPIRGRHNMYNTMAAVLACMAYGIGGEEIASAIRSFKPIEHRLEPVRTLGGVLYVNDSKATNVDAAWYALECQSRPVVWIVGGTDKGNDYSVLEDLVRRKVKAIVCLGVDNSKIHAAFEPVVGSEKIFDTLSAAACVEKCRSLASDGDVVLLSPCCASFDLFKCYEDRGEQFKKAVNELKD